MPSTAPIPYPAEEFDPHTAADPQDMTNLSYAIARLDNISETSYCSVKYGDTTYATGQTLPLGSLGPPVVPGASQALTFPTIVEDPESMRFNSTTIRVNQTGVWTLSAYFACANRNVGGVTGQNQDDIGGWFRINSTNSQDWGATRSHTRTKGDFNNEGLWCTMNINMKLLVNDKIQVYAKNYGFSGSGWTAAVYRAVFSVSLFHPL